MQFIRKYGNLYDRWGNELGPDTQENRVILGQKADAGDPSFNDKQPLFLPGGAFNATYQAPSHAPILPIAQPVQQPANMPSSGVSGQLMDLFKPQGSSGTPVPVANPFADQMNASLRTPAAAVPVANPFADQMNASLRTSAPTAPAAQTFTPQSIPAAPTQERAGSNRYQGDLTASEQRLQDLINSPSSLQDSASYKFRVQQGQEALQRSLGARGLLNSGNRLMDLTKYGQDMASMEYEAENARRKAMYDAASGNYNTVTGLENARVGQANATAANIYGTQVGGVNAANATRAAAIAAANAAANTRYGIDTTARTAQMGTLADLYRGADTTATQRYGIDTQAGAARMGTVADLYRGADTTATQRYGIDTTAGTARANTLADLYRTDVGANTAKLPYTNIPNAPQPWWVTTPTDFMGRPIQRT